MAVINCLWFKKPFAIVVFFTRSFYLVIFTNSGHKVLDVVVQDIITVENQYALLQPTI